MEIWESIKEYDGLYEISSWGRCRSLNRTVVCKRGYLMKLKGKVLSPLYRVDGYQFFILNKNGEYAHFAAHRLVACAFIPNPENKETVNHINGVKIDNRIENLEWATRSENSQHAFDTYLKSNTGECHPVATLKNAQVLEIFNSAKPNRELATLYNTKISIIQKIKSGESWGKITGKNHVPNRNYKKLTKEKVLEVFNSELKQVEIAKKYNIHKQYVNMIKTGKACSHITGKVYVPKKETTQC